MPAFRSIGDRLTWIADAGDKYPAQLSGGMGKRAALARALALDPEILFPVEPTSGLDPFAADAFDKLIEDLQSGLGLTVFLVTHDLDTLFTICGRVTVLVDKKVRVGTIEQLLHDGHPWVRGFLQGPRGRAALLQAPGSAKIGCGNSLSESPGES